MEKESLKTKEKKNPFFILSGMCAPVAVNSSNPTAIKIQNPISRNIRLHGFVLRYKQGLEDCVVAIETTDTNRNAKISYGEMGLAVAGANFSAPAFGMFPFPGAKPIFGQGSTLSISLKAQNVGIGAREVMVAILAEEVE